MKKKYKPLQYCNDPIRLHSIKSVKKKFREKIGFQPKMYHILESKEFTERLWTSTFKKGKAPKAFWEIEKKHLKIISLDLKKAFLEVELLLEAVCCSTFENQQKESNRND